jgi:hypothetical protein
MQVSTLFLTIISVAVGMELSCHLREQMSEK